MRGPSRWFDIQPVTGGISKQALVPNEDGWTADWAHSGGKVVLDSRLPYNRVDADILKDA
jgi:hypothetical protein